MRVDDREIEYDEADQPTFQGLPFTGTVVEHYRDGRVATETDFRDGLRHGWSRIYYPDGTLKQEREYIEGSREGQSRFWYPSGQLQSAAIFGSEPYPNTLLQYREWDEEGNEKIS